MPGLTPDLSARKRENACWKILREQGFLSAKKITRSLLGKCDRCGSVVEPRLSAQWFIKIQPLAERAIEVVEKDYIRFTPANYRQIYLNWMRNIHDWCISRQLWWGHQIPAWYCEMRRDHRRAGNAERSVRNVAARS